MNSVVTAVIYSKDNCPHCVRAKMILDSHGIEYNEIKIGREITREEFLEKFEPKGIRTVPQIYIEGEYIGDSEQLAKWSEEVCGGYGEQPL